MVLLTRIIRESKILPLINYLKSQRLKISFIIENKRKPIYKTDKVKDRVKNVIYLPNLEKDDGLQSQNIRTIINEENSLNEDEEDEDYILTAFDTNNGFEVKFIDYVLNEIKHISDIDEFFDTINFLSEEYGFSLKRGIRNKKGEYKLFYAICNKGIRNAKYYTAESQKKGTPTK